MDERNLQASMQKLLDAVQVLHMQQAALALALKFIIEKSPNAQALRDGLPLLLEQTTETGLFHPISDEHLEVSKAMLRNLFG